MYFRNYGLQKTWLDECLKRPVSEHFLTVHMLKAPKDCGKVHNSIFVIFSHHYEGSRVQKSLF